MSRFINTIATKEDVIGETSSLRKDIRGVQKDVFRWMLFFAITQAGVTSAILFYVLK